MFPERVEGKFPDEGLGPRHARLVVQSWRPGQKSRTHPVDSRRLRTVHVGDQNRALSSPASSEFLVYGVYGRKASS